LELASLLQQIQAESGPLRGLRERGTAPDRRVLFAEAGDLRIQLAAAALKRIGLVTPLLLSARPYSGLPADLERILGPECWLDPAAGGMRQEAADLIWRRRRHRGVTQGQAFVLAAQPLHLSHALLALGEVDAVVAGASAPTAEVARSSLRIIGPDVDTGTVAGAFLMLPPSSGAKPLLMADCAVVPEPTAKQLVDIARATARSYRVLFSRWPALAFLSFSTRGSAQHPAAVKVAEAAALLRAERPDWKIEGEVQVDAALVADVARAKGINWGEEQSADVLIFPDLGSGNIGSKLVERVACWRAIGPFLQGLRRPVCDLSRGCSALDAFDAAVLATLLASPPA
jgi:phosphate acetyltransferase